MDAKGGRPARAFGLSVPPAVNETPTKPEENEGFVNLDNVDASDDEAPAGGEQGGLFGNPPSAGPYRKGF